MRHRRKSLGLAAATALFGGMALAATPSLTPIWTADLGPIPQDRSGPLFYRAAVCSDGSFYLSDGRSGVIQLSATGKVLLDVSGRQEVKTLALICSDKGELILAKAGVISRLKPDGHGDLQLISSVRSGFIKTAGIAETDGPPFFLLGLRQPRPEIVHVVDQTGNITGSFGAMPANPTESQSIGAVFNGSLVWNPTNRQAVFLAENPYEFQVYDRDSGLVGTVPRNDADFRTMSDPSGIADRVVRGAFLPNGDLVVQVLKRRLTATNHMRTIVYLEVFDPAFHLKTTGISTAGFGHFEGIAQDGTFYFSLISARTGIHVIAARLQ